MVGLGLLLSSTLSRSRWLLTIVQLMTWASYSVLQFTDTPGNHTYTAFTDLTTLKSTLVDVTNIKHDMFCPGAPLLRSRSVACQGIFNLRSKGLGCNPARCRCKTCFA